MNCRVPGRANRARLDGGHRGGSSELTEQVQILNAFTVDVEDYYQVSAFSCPDSCGCSGPSCMHGHVHRDQWDRWESRVERNTHRMLQLLEMRGVRGTFFVLGWVAKRFPQLVREIHSAGHEVGSHGYWHRLVYELSPRDFRDDLRQSCAALEDAIGAGVTSHRAASFSIAARSWWALEILVEEGYSVDSSILPGLRLPLGVRSIRERGAGSSQNSCSRPPALHFRHLHRLSTSAGGLWEFPPSVARIAGVNLPVSGGGYFRLFPLSWTHYCLRRINRREGQPFMFYVHPWELDPRQPRVPTRSRLSRFRHYVGLQRCEVKLDRLLERFRFGRLCDVIAGAEAPDQRSGLGSRGSDAGCLVR